MGTIYMRRLYLMSVSCIIVISCSSDPYHLSHVSSVSKTAKQDEVIQASPSEDLLAEKQIKDRKEPLSTEQNDTGIIEVSDEIDKFTEPVHITGAGLVCYPMSLILIYCKFESETEHLNDFNWTIYDESGNEMDPVLFDVTVLRKGAYWDVMIRLKEPLSDFVVEGFLLSSGVNSDLSTNTLKTKTKTISQSTQIDSSQLNLIVEDICKTQRQTKVSKLLNFPAREHCSFGVEDNLAAKNGYLSAREVQSLAVGLPSEAVLCDLKLQSTSDSWHYDDWIVFTLNDKVLASSMADLVFDRLEQENGSYIWNWDQAKDFPFTSDLNPYCISDTCSFPKHDEMGPVNFEFKLDGIFDFSANILNADLFHLNLILMGDNDPGDCYHNGLELEVSYSYTSMD